MLRIEGAVTGVILDRSRGRFVYRVTLVLGGPSYPPERVPNVGTLVGVLFPGLNEERSVRGANVSFLQKKKRKGRPLKTRVVGDASGEPRVTTHVGAVISCVTISEGDSMRGTVSWDPRGDYVRTIENGAINYRHCGPSVKVFSYGLNACSTRFILQVSLWVHFVIIACEILVIKRSHLWQRNSRESSLKQSIVYVVQWMLISQLKYSIDRNVSAK